MIKIKKIIVLIAVVFLSFKSFATANALLPNDFYYPIGSSLIPQIKCVGSFYEHNQTEYFPELKEGVAIKFNNKGSASTTFEGKHLEVAISSSLGADYTNDNGINIENIFDLTVTIQARIKGTNFLATEYVEYRESISTASLQINGSDHFFIECYPVKIQ